MAKTKWTQEQQDAIDSRRGTILVSAAAGSGKTAVLVQRAISLLTEGENPVPADRLLIVTFTRAAAAEMRSRLEKRLYELIRTNPKDEHLKRQSILLAQANIGTIHSFCADLLREFFTVLNLPPDFKIITDKQEEDMKNDVVSEVLNQAAEQSDYDVLADNFTGERDDAALSRMIIQLYAHMTSYPNPAKWMEEKIEMYNTSLPAGQTPWGQAVLSYTAQTIEYATKLMQHALYLVEDGGDAKLQKAYVDAFSADLAWLQALQNTIKLGDWNSIRSGILGFKQAPCRAPNGYKDDPLKLKVSGLREEAKSTIAENLAKLFACDEQQCADELQEAGSRLAMLASLLKEFTTLYSAKKLEKSFLDYADLEQYTLKLLQTDDGQKSSFAERISGRFAEIMIDEFQDMNEVQDTIFSYVSKNRTNLFMVGDVKQSIYGFRRAMPEIFMRNKDSFAKYDRTQENYPAYIVLGRNFRSRDTVTESTNFVFSQLMNRQTAGMDYTDEEALVCGASYPEKEGCETELILIEKETGVLPEQTEARFIADKINEMRASGFTVQENGNERPVQFGDFCILLRSANSYAHGYASELQRMGIPAKAATANGFFETREIGAVLSFLRVIDNPNQDIPLLTVLMSPVYGFTPDDMLSLRAKYPKMPLYTALLHAEKEEPRIQAVLQDIAAYRVTSATMPSDEFIQLLYLKSGYADLVLAMPDGENRLANLRLLQTYARDYEASGYNGVSGFIRFLDRLSRNRSDLKSADIAESGENAVQIMSVHKSKGLEFPVCFVAGCAREKSNRPQDILLHPELGFGIYLADRTTAAKYSTLPREAILIDSARKEAAEEMRILYVAMTRAREKLILVGTPTNPEGLLEKVAAQIGDDGFSAFTVQTAKSFAEWLLLCALRHPSAGALRHKTGLDADVVCHNYTTPWQISLISRVTESEVEEKETALPASPDEELLAKLKQNCDYIYPHAALTVIPSKTAASVLAAKNHREQQGLTLPRPSWLYEKKLTPAEKGVALHSYMQYCNFSLAAENPAQELERLLQNGFLTTEQANAIDLQKVSIFLESTLGQRVAASLDVQRERRFTVEIPAQEAGYTTEESHENATMLLQGALDCTFVENGQLHIIDFKTDYVKDVQELANVYAIQIRLYRKAMEQISEYPVGECWIYSMHCGQAVLLDNI